MIGRVSSPPKAALTSFQRTLRLHAAMQGTVEWLGSDARRRQMHGGQVGPVKVPVLGWSLRLPRWLHKPWNVLRLVRARGDRVSCNPAPAAIFLLRRLL